MDRAAQHRNRSFLVRGEAFVQQHILWLLLGCYALAAILPRPGLALREWRLPLPIQTELSPSLPMQLLAVMLFCAALLIDLSQIKAAARRPAIILLGVVGVWFAPVVFAFSASLALSGNLEGGMLAGLALLAAMPVANSSVAWSQSAQANLPLSLALVLLSIGLSPWAAPALLRLLMGFLSPADQDTVQQILIGLDGREFIIWVIVPTLLGCLAHWAAGSQRIGRVKTLAGCSSLAALLALNYVNASLVLPHFLREAHSEGLLVAAALALAFSLWSMACGYLISGLCGAHRESRASLVYGLGMKHTGLALVLAGSVGQSAPLVILVIMLATICQHIAAGFAHRWLREAPGPTQPPDGSCTSTTQPVKISSPS